MDAAYWKARPGAIPVAWPSALSRRTGPAVVGHEETACPAHLHSRRHEPPVSHARDRTRRGVGYLARVILPACADVERHDKADGRRRQGDKELRPVSRLFRFKVSESGNNPERSPRPRKQQQRDPDDLALRRVHRLARVALPARADVEGGADKDERHRNGDVLEDADGWLRLGPGQAWRWPAVASAYSNRTRDGRFG